MTPDATDFLYPFIDAEGGDDPSQLLDDLEASATSKLLESFALTQSVLESFDSELDAIASEAARRIGSGGSIFTMGNGGSATDARALAQLYCAPPTGAPLRSRCLVDDEAVVTALANDVGFDLVFSRQLIAYGGRADVLVGFSTSGNSRNLLQAFAEARDRRMLTVGLAGYSGGEMASSPDIDHCLVVRSESVHRIQEAQAALAFSMWSKVQRLVCEEGPR